MVTSFSPNAKLHAVRIYFRILLWHVRVMSPLYGMSLCSDTQTLTMQNHRPLGGQ